MHIQVHPLWLFFWHINYWRFLTKHDLLRVCLPLPWVGASSVGVRGCPLSCQVLVSVLLFVSVHVCLCGCAFVCKRKVFSVCFSFSFRLSFLPFAKLFTLKIFLRLFRSQLAANAVPDRDGTSPRYVHAPLKPQAPPVLSPLPRATLRLFTLTCCSCCSCCSTLFS